MASSRIEMDDYENATKLVEDLEIYEEIETAHEDKKKDPMLKFRTAHGNIKKDTVLKTEKAYGNIKNDTVLNLSLKKWLQFILLPLLMVSFLSISLILTVVYFSFYAKLEAKMEKKYAFLMTKQNINATEVNAIVNEARAELEEKLEKKYAFLMTKQNISATEIHAKCNDARDELELKMEKKYEFLIAKQNATEIYALANEARGYDELKLKRAREIVAFTAYRSSSQHLSSSTKVLFDKVWNNIGNGYDTSSGIFTAPHAGIYHFGAVILSQDGKNFYLILYHNSVMTSGSWVTGDGFKTGSFDVILSLQSGDIVYIAATTDSSIYSDSAISITFSGHNIF